MALSFDKHAMLKVTAHHLSTSSHIVESKKGLTKMKKKLSQLDNIEMITISKDPAYIVDNMVKRILENFALTLMYNF